MESAVCPTCHSEYAKIGNHWQHNPEHRPSLTQNQREIVTGLMMGDGTLGRSNRNPYVKVLMITKEYLEHLDTEFDILGLGVSLNKTAEKSAQENRDSGFRPNAKGENYHDAYQWMTRSLPELGDWNWYGTGEKVWPEDIELTPTVLKHWYCGDGCRGVVDTSSYISIAMSNEIGNTEKVSRYFSRAGLTEPGNYTENGIDFTVDASHELWNYMGEPLPGFEYKWPEEYH